MTTFWAFCIVAVIALAVGCCFAAAVKRVALRRTVFANLDSAYENGYFDPGEYLNGALPYGLAHDLTAYAADMEDKTIAELVPHVRAWLRMKGLGQ